MDHKIENLRLDLDLVLASTQFAAVYVERIFAELVPH
jgi:hypothetical protein